MTQQKSKLVQKTADYRLATVTQLSHVSWDLHGPYAIEGVAGAKYVAVAVDAGTAHTYGLISCRTRKLELSQNLLPDIVAKSVFQVVSLPTIGRSLVDYLGSFVIKKAPGLYARNRFALPAMVW